nr:probable LRR receptor-like serine/threonine-protein kinase At1g74360 [Ipomoea batatas]
MISISSKVSPTTAASPLTFPVSTTYSASTMTESDEEFLTDRQRRAVTAGNPTVSLWIKFNSSMLVDHFPPSTSDEYKPFWIEICQDYNDPIHWVPFVRKMKQIKQEMVVGANHFNQDPKKGMEFVSGMHSIPNLMIDFVGDVVKEHARAWTLASGDSLETDKNVLLNLKSFIEHQSTVNRGSRYTKWNSTDLSPCNWPGISCFGGRVTGLNLSGNYLNGEMFDNFSALTSLSYLDLSSNTIDGAIQADLGKCLSLRFLNLSHNIINGEPFNWPEEFGGSRRVGEQVSSLNNLSGDLLFGFDQLKELSVAQNSISGTLPWWVFNQSCSLQSLDLSENKFFGGLPKEISNCKDLRLINLSGNNFSGPIPKEIGSLQSLEGLYLGGNTFSRQIPHTLTALHSLVFLDLSSNNFRGEIQENFGQFTQVRFLLLYGNGYTGGIVASGITKLVNLSRLDLSYNNFSGPLPVEISQMTNLKFLVLAFNQFTGPIPSEYGDFPGLQALDLSSNGLNGTIPPSLGRLTSLLWLMLANNSLTGEIPPELGNCSSLLWLNLASNELSGSIPPELANVGSNPMPTFLLNQGEDKIRPESGECLAFKRWIPADYPPFSFVYPLLTREKCRSLWNMLLKGVGIYSICQLGTTTRTYKITGYVQLSGNKLSGLLPSDIGKMRNFSSLFLGDNNFHGNLPAEIGGMPLQVLNLTGNKFSGKIPSQIGNIKCLQNLDLSYNDFSGAFPISLNNLTELNRFNISYNPNINGIVPARGQIATFDKWSFLGDPLLLLPSFIDNSTDIDHPGSKNEKLKKPTETEFWVGFREAFDEEGNREQMVTDDDTVLTREGSDSRRPGELSPEVRRRRLTRLCGMKTLGRTRLRRL